jgi:peptidoglycan/LPS O-acetylase OafA/YrhL
MRKLKSIQALRAIAAILVVIDHIFSRVEGLNPALHCSVRRHITILVRLVFRFSFASAVSLWHTSNGNGGLSDAVLFLKKRAIRIYPIYIITLLSFVAAVKHFATSYNINFWVDVSDSNVLKGYS